MRGLLDLHEHDAKHCHAPSLPHKRTARPALGCAPRNVEPLANGRLLNRKRLKSSLVKMPGTLCPVVRVPAHGMSVRQPTKERGQLLVRFRADHEVPMIGHHTVRINRERMTIERLLQDTFERPVVLRFLEQRQSRHGPIEDVKANTSRTDTGASGHATSLPYAIARIKSCVPLFRPRPLIPSRVGSDARLSPED